MDKLLYLTVEFDNDTQIELKHFENIIKGNGFIGKQTKDIPYHITLCTYTPDMENIIVKMMEEIENKKLFSVFNVSFSSFGLFGLNVLFLNPEMNMNLIEMYNFVKNKGSYNDSDLAAHVTLFIDEQENILNILPKMVEEFKTRNEKINCKIKYLSLIEYFPRRFIKRIELLD
jgi:2'-5' RNA ligase